MDKTMSPARLLTAALRTASHPLVALVASTVIWPGPADAQDRAVQAYPMQVTSDTPEYCLHLLDRVSALVSAANTPVPREVTDLTTEGHRMCTHGQTRSGIMRLRSALMLMEKGDAATYR